VATKTALTLDQRVEQLEELIYELIEYLEDDIGIDQIQKPKLAAFANGYWEERRSGADHA
jgi:hypothetical protein